MSQNKVKANIAHVFFSRTVNSLELSSTDEVDHLHHIHVLYQRFQNPYQINYQIKLNAADMVDFKK